MIVERLKQEGTTKKSRDEWAHFSELLSKAAPALSGNSDFEEFQKKVISDQAESDRGALVNAYIQALHACIDAESPSEAVLDLVNTSWAKLDESMLTDFKEKIGQSVTYVVSYLLDKVEVILLGDLVAMDANKVMAWQALLPLLPAFLEVSVCAWWEKERQVQAAPEELELG